MNSSLTQLADALAADWWQGRGVARHRSDRQGCGSPVSHCTVAERETLWRHVMRGEMPSQIARSMGCTEELARIRLRIARVAVIRRALRDAPQTRQETRNIRRDTHGDGETRRG